MRDRRLHVETPLETGVEIFLDEARAHRLTRVLRLREGDEVIAFDGRGGEHRCRLARHARRWALTPLEFQPREAESPLAVTLVQSVSRNERMDIALQKATELGVRAVQPVLAGRSVKRDVERARRRHGHWRRVIAQACEQCGRNRLPDLHSALDLGEWLQQSRTGFVLSPLATGRLAEAERPPGEFGLLIGPEGGFSAVELDAAERAGLQSVSLGPRILRTETAALAALSVLQARHGDFS